MSNFIKAKIYEISENGEFIILAMESDIDHVHLMIQYLPKISISYIIQKIKQITTFYVWRNKKFELFLKQNFWKEKTFWTDGFFACSIGEANPETIKTYIENQGQNSQSSLAFNPTAKAVGISAQKVLEATIDKNVSLLEIKVKTL